MHDLSGFPPSTSAAKAVKFFEPYLNSGSFRPVRNTFWFQEEFVHVQKTPEHTVRNLNISDDLPVLQSSRAVDGMTVIHVHAPVERPCNLPCESCWNIFQYLLLLRILTNDRNLIYKF
jgi:hypothetical protein